MNNGPHLTHRGRRITTDATLKSDLEASVALTNGRGVLRKDLARLEAKVDALSQQIDRLGQAMVLLAENDGDLRDLVAAAMEDMPRAMHVALARLVTRYEEQKPS